MTLPFDLASATWLVPLPVVVPLIGAGLAVVASRRAMWQRAITISSLVVTLLGAALLLAATSVSDAPLVMETAGWVPPQGVVLVGDRLAALMVLVAVTITLGVVLFAIGQGRASDDVGDGESPLPIFHPSLLILMAGVDTTFVSGDLFHTYVGFEMLLVASFVLLTLRGTADRVQSGVNYVFVSLLSSMLFLLALAMVYAACGTVNIAQLAGRLDMIPEGTRTVVQVLLLIGFAVKAAVFPMSGWLPDSYPTASAPVTAVFAGLLTKVGIYAIIRTQTLLFPGTTMHTILMWAALLTMLIGIVAALAQDDIKRLLSFTLVSHIGYMLFGVAVGGSVGLSAAIFYVAHHIIVQTALFLVVGVVERVGGSTSMARLGGLARTAPFVAVLFFVPAMNLAGIPPLSGFLGKVGLLQAGAQLGTPLGYLLIAGSLVTSLLTLYAVGRVWSRAFWRAPLPPQESPEDTRLRERIADGEGAPAGVASAAVGGSGAGSSAVGVSTVSPGLLDAAGEERAHALPRGLALPALLLVLVSCSLTLVAGPLYDFTDTAAQQLIQRTPYIDAVFPGGAP